MNAIFISARSNSSRLKNKLLTKIKNKHAIEYVIEGCKKSKLVDKIVLCTTKNKNDSIFCEIAKSHKINSHRGEELCKLKRWKGACEAFDLDFFVTADGDDLLYDGGLADLCFQQKQKKYLLNGQGLYNDVYGIPLSIINFCLENTTDIIETHVLVDFARERGLPVQNLRNVPWYFKKHNMRLTLDYYEDFLFFEKVISNLPDNFTFLDAIQYLKENEEAVNINLFRETDWRIHQNNKG